MEDILQWIEKNQESHIEELKTFLKIPSVSADDAYQNGIQECARYLENHLKEIGLENTKIFSTQGNPVVYADWCHAPGKPTILFYGHYDVQPPDPLELWESPPFEPTVRDHAIYARGVSDDKGQVFCHLKAIQGYLSQKKALPLNIKLILEGEEEIGSPNLSAFIQEQQQLLRSDIVLISDTPMFNKEQPSICYSLRGLVYLEIELKTAKQDLHSGQHGGAVPNAIHVLAHLLTQLKDEKGRILIPGFYDEVAPLNEMAKKHLQNLVLNSDQYQKETGAYYLEGECGYSILEQRWSRPTLDCNGLFGGYIKQGAKTIIPALATAKISMRLVGNQSSEDIVRKFKSYLKEKLPASCQMTLTEIEGADPVTVDIENPGIEAGLQALEKAYGKKPVLLGEGGSIPIVRDFKDLLGLDAVLMGFNLPDDGIHAPNERFGLENFYKGIQAATYFYEAYAKD